MSKNNNPRAQQQRSNNWMTTLTSWFCLLSYKDVLLKLETFGWCSIWTSMEQYIMAQPAASYCTVYSTVPWHTERYRCLESLEIYDPWYGIAFMLKLLYKWTHSIALSIQAFTSWAFTSSQPFMPFNRTST